MQTALTDVFIFSKTSCSWFLLDVDKSSWRDQIQGRCWWYQIYLLSTNLLIKWWFSFFKLLITFLRWVSLDTRMFNSWYSIRDVQFVMINSWCSVREVHFVICNTWCRWVFVMWVHGNVLLTLSAWLQGELIGWYSNLNWYMHELQQWWRQTHELLSVHTLELRLFHGGECRVIKIHI